MSPFENFGELGNGARADLLLDEQRLVHVLGQEPQSLLAYLRIQVLHVVDELDHRVDVKACLDAHRMPQDRGRVEHERLQEQYKRHPLIVGYVGFLQVVGTRDALLPRQVVRVRDPAYVVGVLDVRARELSWTPA